MLTELCNELKNWFINGCNDIITNEFTIDNGVLAPSVDLKEDQYFRIVGSTFNDGVHAYDDELIDEEFDGAVWRMNIPKAVLDLNDEIDEYNSKYGAVSPYASESFGGYSYSKQHSDWRSAFASKMNAWRKLR